MREMGESICCSSPRTYVQIPGTLVKAGAGHACLQPHPVLQGEGRSRELTGHPA